MSKRGWAVATGVRDVMGGGVDDPWATRGSPVTPIASAIRVDRLPNASDRTLAAARIVPPETGDTVVGATSCAHRAARSGMLNPSPPPATIPTSNRHAPRRRDVGLC
ncbi:hypothetical protein ASG12_10235 [Williamsia sp. Leaf354]|nr:hypothetical protein ASG12_10235 [Williamsia sp. Leaf354]